MKYVIDIKVPREFRIVADDYREQFSTAVTGISSLGLHCTLMTAHAPEHAESDMLGELERIAHKPFIAQLTGKTALFSEDKLVAVLERSPELHALHRGVVERLVKYIDWNEQHPLPHDYKIDKRRKEAHDKFGSAYYGDFYAPHVSIAALDVSKLETVTFPHIMPYAWTVREFTISKPQNNVMRPIKTFPLRA